MDIDILNYLRVTRTRFNCHAEAADEIQRLRLMAHNLYEELKRCGTRHDVPATWDYEQWLEDND